MKRWPIVSISLATAIFAIITLVLSVLLSGGLIGTRVELVKQERCVKVVDVKYYKNRLLILRSDRMQTVYVLADGREIGESELYNKRDAMGNVCEVVYVPK
ncbi:MAG: hypothetical protein Q8Q41_02435 [bacterium]|nr:hypothetical protein [bacterium]